MTDSVASVGLPAIARSDARVLIVGTLPGAVSLALGRYYAQPSNAFWRIMEQLIGASAASPYAERTHGLTENGLALWDVCAEAERTGSLDSEIATTTVVPNDFATFLASHRDVQLLAFNGRKTATLFRQMVLRTLSPYDQLIRGEVLPSTSAAHASMPFAEKLERWRGALSPVIAREQLGRGQP